LNYAITIRYFNPILNIGLQDVRNAWYLADQTPIQLTTIIYQGALYFRFPGRETDKLQKTKKGVDKKTNHSTASVGIIAFLKTLKHTNKKSRMARQPPANGSF